jgi:hypothetical protein
LTCCGALQSDDIAAKVGDVEAEGHGRVVIDVAQLGLARPAVHEDGLVVTEQIPDRHRVGLAGRGHGGEPGHDVRAQAALDAQAPVVFEPGRETHGCPFLNELHGISAMTQGCLGVVGGVAHADQS